MCLGSLFSHGNFLEFLRDVVEEEACNMLSVSSMAEDRSRCICFSQWMDLIVETLEFKLGLSFSLFCVMMYGRDQIAGAGGCLSFQVYDIWLNSLGD